MLLRENNHCNNPSVQPSKLPSKPLRTHFQHTANVRLKLIISEINQTTALVVLGPYGPMYTTFPGSIKISILAIKMVISKINESRAFHWYLSQQILTDPHRVIGKKKTTSNIGGKVHCQFCYLPATLYRSLPLLEKKPAKISCERKTIKWAIKMAIRREKKGKKEESEKKIEIDSQKKSKFWLNCARAKKR